MPWTQTDVDWVAARLAPAIRDINQDIIAKRIHRRLQALYLELMKIRITEEVFFFGQQRKPGDVMDVEVGPFRTEVVPGGLKRIPQFVEMAEEITQQHPAAPVAEPAPAPVVPPPASFADATAAVLAPKPAPAAPKGNPVAARIRALTTRRAKFEDQVAAILDPAEATMAKVETEAPAILQRAHQASQDELTAIQDLDSSLKALDPGNGPLQS